MIATRVEVSVSRSLKSCPFRNGIPIAREITGSNLTNQGANPEGLSNSETSRAEEQIYICGARTKKGTPCSRRVHGPVRCWQHKGMPAMLAQEKLLVKE